MLPLLLIVALAAPALAAPDFEPMRDCDPAQYKRFGVVKTFLDLPQRADATAEEKQKKLKALDDAMHGLTLATDDLFWPAKDGAALPEACKVDEAKLKDGIYGGLAALRARIGERAKAAAAEEDKELSEALTRQEIAADELMGDRRKSLGAIAASLREQEGKAAGFGDPPEAMKGRVEHLKYRLAEIRRRVSASAAAGVSAPGGPGDEPAAVKESARKRAEEARKRAGGAMNGGFEPEKRDETPNGAPAGGAATPRPYAAGAAVATGGRAKASRRGADPIDSAGLDGAGGTDSSKAPDATPGTVGHAIKGAAGNPLGGVISPPSEAEAVSWNARKEEAKKAARRIAQSSDKFAEMDAIEERGFNVQSLKLAAGGAGEVTLERTKGQRERMRFGVKDWRIDKIAESKLTPEEIGTIEADLEAARERAQAR